MHIPTSKKFLVPVGTECSRDVEEAVVTLWLCHLTGEVTLMCASFLWSKVKTVILAYLQASGTVDLYEQSLEK